jgi:hypothetical protein
VHQLVLRELLPHALVHLVWDVVLGDERERFGPLQRGALARRIVWRVAPRVEAVEPLFGLAVRARILAVHVQTVGATVDLRRAHPDEVEQSVIEAGLTNLPFEAQHGLHDAWIHVHEIDSSFHDVFHLHKSRRSRNNPVTPGPWPAAVTGGLRRSSKEQDECKATAVSHGSD